MRWFFLLLVFANLLGWYWFSAAAEQRSVIEGGHQPVRQAGAGVSRLVLFGEAGEAAAESLMSGAVVSADVQGEGLKSDQLVLDSGETLVEQGDLMFKENPIPDVQAELSFSTGVIPDELGRNSGFDKSSGSDQEPVLLESGGEECSLVGPFLSDTVVEEVRARLGGVDIVADKVIREVVVREVFWLMIASQGSLQQTKEILRELQGKNIDSFLIEDGDFVNDISLGVFGNWANVESYRSSLVEKGYQPRIVPLPRFEDQHWLSVLNESLAKLSGEFWGDISELTGEGEMLVEKVVCK